MSEAKFKPVFIFLDTDKHASPFDILMTLDLIPDVVVLKYENVTPEDVEKIVYDALFPRGPKGIKYTKVFVNGKELETVNAIVEKIRKCMFPPFELSVIVDPRGSYTTASAAVVKTLEILRKLGLGGIEGKNVTVLAGTGPVGVAAAWLYAAEKAVEVIVTSREITRAQKVASRINEELKTDVVKPFQARTPEDVGRAIENADIVLATGAPGVQLLPLNTLKTYGKKVKVVADCNAVPPYGIEGLDPKWDGKEVIPGVYGVGALVIGTLKNKIEAELIKKALQEPKGIFDFRTAYEIGKAMLPTK
ncbi:MAG: methylenetetrahydromethanopterin dehydrogenase [Desulfurococcaceae archaeon]|nr:methylenetetrahydromethanopterin dehydrogenase [Desulfurococcaceae archaeon]